VRCGLAIGDWFYTSVGRPLGDAAALLGDRTSARAYYEQALYAANKIRFRPELALTHLRFAELLVVERDGSEARQHLEAALSEFTDMKMQPALQRGLYLLEQVQNRASTPASHSTDSHVLTGREWEVARLLAAGRSNREIADALVITEGTAEVHVKHILSKLGFRSRAQVAGWLARQRST
jgi:DNA-binding CsgD family transcriptional regulator